MKSKDFSSRRISEVIALPVCFAVGFLVCPAWAMTNEVVTMVGAMISATGEYHPGDSVSFQAMSIPSATSTDISSGDTTSELTGDVQLLWDVVPDAPLAKHAQSQVSAQGTILNASIKVQCEGWLGMTFEAQDVGNDYNASSDATAIGSLIAHDAGVAPAVWAMANPAHAQATWSVRQMMGGMPVPPPPGMGGLIVSGSSNPEEDLPQVLLPEERSP